MDHSKLCIRGSETSLIQSTLCLALFPTFMITWTLGRLSRNDLHSKSLLILLDHRLIMKRQEEARASEDYCGISSVQDRHGRPASTYTLSTSNHASGLILGSNLRCQDKPMRHSAPFMNKNLKDLDCSMPNVSLKYPDVKPALPCAEPSIPARHNEIKIAAASLKLFTIFPTIFLPSHSIGNSLK
ncbi:uncharacterized protein MELLADRAFT_105501 [Melampsora larici-populina 98AG31]|uniref:Uncharacterized protein n=1 Tax=Melampsora larici-populina (strain 98AG31 / pathotype 3-4-7) TaxID=747676 RepID=F4RID1_MELLP|nr:uncharacterized protein MELLADRAFT_105501 [Melampsora larici-populina 98AG31]EGG07987.1 hypothetical protein MELLADRAFT_105501 [Melampsora larici-populina 98AG31]